MKHLIIFILVCVLYSCRDKYELLSMPEQTSYLVVEGFINTAGVTNIKLSRTTQLQTRGMQFEEGADLQIEGENNTSFSLTGSDSGRYVSQELLLDEAVKYRLKIKTFDNKEYLSGFALPIKTPPLDSITYSRYNGGVEIFVDTKSDNNTEYYRFEYEEDWEFKSPYRQALLSDFSYSSPTKEVLVRPFGPRYNQDFNDSLYTCWQHRESSSLILGTTAKLNEDRVYMPVVFYPRGSWELSYLYAIKIKQFGLSKEGFMFYQKMRKNTESLGSIFDAQPSEITGNIQSITNPSEKIIGHIEATKSTEKRIFIKNSDLTDWGYTNSCTDTLARYDPSLLWWLIAPGTRILTVGEYDNSGTLIGVHLAAPDCVDCTRRGKHERPSFWPN